MSAPWTSTQPFNKNQQALSPANANPLTRASFSATLNNLSKTTTPTLQTVEKAPVSIHAVTDFKGLLKQPQLTSPLEIRSIGDKKDLYIVEFRDFQACQEALNRISEDVTLIEYYPLSSIAYFFNSKQAKESLNPAEIALKDNLFSAGLMTMENTGGEAKYTMANPQATIIWATPDPPDSPASDSREEKISAALSSYLFDNDPEYQTVLIKDWVSLPQTRRDI